MKGLITMDTEKIGKLIATCRKSCGLTQQQLADEIGISSKAISKWETGQGLPDVTMLTLLADTLGITVDELLSGEKTEKNETGNGEISEYSVNQTIFWFRIMAVLSMLFALGGIIVPCFMIMEAAIVTALLFGCWLEFCSFGIFSVFYFFMKNGMQHYNKRSTHKRNAIKIRNQFVRFEMWLWIIAPASLIVWLMTQMISLDILAVQAIMAFVLYLAVGILIWKKFVKVK